MKLRRVAAVCALMVGIAVSVAVGVWVVNVALYEQGYTSESPIPPPPLDAIPE
jgi:uncharacterized membrane protein YiaA